MPLHAPVRWTLTYDIADPDRDDVRVYRWPARTTVDRLGPPLFIEELLPDYHLDLPLAA